MYIRDQVKGVFRVFWVYWSQAYSDLSFDSILSLPSSTQLKMHREIQPFGNRISLHILSATESVGIQG